MTTNPTQIKRYRIAKNPKGYFLGMDDVSDGEYIKYTDHLEEVKRLKQERHSEDELTDISHRIANYLHMPYCWEDIRNRLHNQYRMPEPLPLDHITKEQYKKLQSNDS